VENDMDKRLSEEESVSTGIIYSCSGQPDLWIFMYFKSSTLNIHNCCSKYLFLINPGIQFLITKLLFIIEINYIKLALVIEVNH